MTVAVEKKKLTEENFNDFWYRLEEHENSDNVWTVSPDWVKRTLGINNIYSRILQLESRVDTLERPLRKQAIVDLLTDQGQHNREWIQNRAKKHDYWGVRNLLDELIKEGKVTSQRKGTQEMFSLVNQKV